MKMIDGVCKQRVLVVDDHPDTTEVLSQLFRLLGHETFAVQRGHDALEVVRGFDPDLVVLDITLPDISGYDVARALKQQCGRVRYLAAATGWGREKDRILAHEAGFNYHLTKPFDISQLRQLLQLSASYHAAH